MIPSFGLELIEYIIFDLLIVTDSPFIDFLLGAHDVPSFRSFRSDHHSRVPRNIDASR